MARALLAMGTMWLIGLGIVAHLVGSILSVRA